MSAIYFVEVRYSQNIGQAFRETDTDKNSLREVVDDIASDEYSGVVVRVIEADPDEGYCREVTHDVAQLVYDAIDNDGGPPCPNVVDFLEREVGISAVNYLRRNAA